MIRTSRLFAPALAAALMLGGCALGSDTRYRLIEPQIEPPEARSTAADAPLVAVGRPVADQARDSSRILVRRQRSLLPWPGVAWIDRAPDLVQDLLVSYLDGSVATAGRQGSLPASHRLDLVLRRFEMVEREAGLQAQLLLTARLFAPDGRLVDVVRIERVEPASASDSVDAAVAAMETALRDGFQRLAEWLEREIEGPDSPG